MTTGHAGSVRCNRRRREAKEWVVLQEPHQAWSAALQRRWDKWSADELNLAEFREYERIDRLIRALPRQPRPTSAELHPPFFPNGVAVRLLLCACVMACIAVAALLWFSVDGARSRTASITEPAQERVYQTNLGEESTVTLDDNTVAKLSGDSSMRVVIAKDVRHVTLLKGEVMFQVAHNPRVPFLVDVAAARVTDLGTVIHIRYYSSNQQVTIAVVEGAVTVAPLERSSSGAAFGPVTLMQGEEVSADATGKISRAHPADFRAMDWWRDGRRVYRGKPLGQVIEDLALYSSQRIGFDEELATVPFTGIVDQKHPEQWVRGLAVSFPVEIDDSNPRQLVIRCRYARCRLQP